jgi:integrase
MVTQIPMSSPTHLFPEQHQIITDVRRRSLLSVQFARICERVGITSRSFHCIRHTAAGEKYRSLGKEDLAKRLAENLSMAQIKSLLGHSSAKTTRGYVH